MAQIIKKKKAKTLSDDVLQIIRNDIPLRQKIADALEIENNSVYAAALRKSPKLTLPFIVELIAKYTGKPKSEIVES